MRHTKSLAIKPQLSILLNCHTVVWSVFCPGQAEFSQAMIKHSLEVHIGQALGEWLLRGHSALKVKIM